MRKFAFLRDDDVYELNDSFLLFHNLVVEERIPISYGVIPAKIEKDFLEFIKNEIKKYPHIINLCQHGYTHNNYGDNENKYEFGPKRTYEEQKKDLILGFNIMKQHFGTPNVFIPPFHGTDNDTISILEEMDFIGVSANSDTKYENRKFMNIPAQLCLNEYLDNKESFKSLKKILKEYIKLKKNNNNQILGILIHHILLKENEIETLRKFFRFLKNNEGYEFISFNEFIMLKSKVNNNPLILQIKEKSRQIHLKSLTFEVTNKCQLRCKQCDIWKERPYHYLTLDNIKEVIYNDRFLKPIEWVSLTGGEFFEHPDYRGIYRELALMKAKGIVKGLDVVSNGYDTEKILSMFENKALNKGNNFHISIDGTEKEHNYQRGLKDAFDKSIKTLQLLKEKNPEINLCIKYTINPTNYNAILDIYSFCVKNKVQLELKFIESGTTNYYHRLTKDRLKDQEIFNFNENHKNEIKKILTKIYNNEKDKEVQIHRVNTLKVLINSLSGVDVVKRCFTPFYSLFITCNGDIFPCLYYDAIGNIKQTGWESRLMSTKHKEMIKEGCTGKCPKCLDYHGYLKLYNL